MDNKDKQMVEEVSKAVRRQYHDFVTQTLGEKDVLPEQPAPLPPVTNPPPEPSPRSNYSMPPVTDIDSQTKQSAKELRPLKKRNRVADVLFFTVILFLLVVLASAVLQRYFVGSTIIVSGSSMDPTFKSGLEVWVNKSRTPQRGDVVVLYKNDVGNKFWAEFAIGTSAKRGGQYEKLIKRVVALAGDKLWVEEKDGNHVLVIETPEGEIREDYYTFDGQPVMFYDAHGSTTNLVTVPYVDVRQDSNISQGVLTGTTRENPFVVREGRFFFMGDNRLISHDSRDLEDLPLDYVIGVVERVVTV